jgi:hypothetical protein
MKTCWIFVLLCVMKVGCVLGVLGSATPALALSGNIEKATVQAMRTAPCMITGMIPGGKIDSVNSRLDPGNSRLDPAPAPTCIEYELHTGKVSYIIHPHRQILLQVGGDVIIRLAGNELRLRVSGEPKEIRCDVVAMTLQSEDGTKEKEKTKEWKWERPNQPARQNPPGCYSGLGDEISCGEQEAHR